MRQRFETGSCQIKAHSQSLVRFQHTYTSCRLDDVHPCDPSDRVPKIYRCAALELWHIAISTRCNKTAGVLSDGGDPLCGLHGKDRFSANIWHTDTRNIYRTVIFKAFNATNEASLPKILRNSHSTISFTLSALELDIYSLAHHLCKMWIFYEPRRVAVGNTRHFVGE